MTSIQDPLTLPNGQVLPNRIMKSALSEALGTKGNSPDHRLERLYELLARDIREGTHLAPNFRDAVALHEVLDSIEGSAGVAER